MEVLREVAQQADAVGVEAGESPVRLDAQRVDGLRLGGERVAAVRERNRLFLERHGHVAATPAGGDEGA